MFGQVPGQGPSAASYQGEVLEQGALAGDSREVPLETEGPGAELPEFARLEEVLLLHACAQLVDLLLLLLDFEGFALLLVDLGDLLQRQPRLGGAPAVQVLAQVRVQRALGRRVAEGPAGRAEGLGAALVVRVLLHLALFPAEVLLQPAAQGVLRLFAAAPEHAPAPGAAVGPAGPVEVVGLDEAFPAELAHPLRVGVVALVLPADLGELGLDPGEVLVEVVHLGLDVGLGLEQQVAFVQAVADARVQVLDLVDDDAAELFQVVQELDSLVEGRGGALHQLDDLGQLVLGVVQLPVDLHREPSALGVGGQEEEGELVLEVDVVGDEETSVVEAFESLADYGAVHGDHQLVVGVLRGPVVEVLVEFRFVLVERHDLVPGSGLASVPARELDFFLVLEGAQQLLLLHVLLEGGLVVPHRCDDRLRLVQLLSQLVQGGLGRLRRGLRSAQLLFEQAQVALRRLAQLGQLLAQRRRRLERLAGSACLAWRSVVE